MQSSKDDIMFEMPQFRILDQIIHGIILQYVCWSLDNMIIKKKIFSKIYHHIHDDSYIL